MLYKSIDTMKASRDSNAWTNQQKIDHCNAIVANVPDITHITMDCYYNKPGYQSVAYVTEWCDAIHQTGKKIWFRGVSHASEIKETISAAEAITIVVSEVHNHPDWFQDGDIFEYWPESGPYGFTDGWDNDGTAWSQWHSDMISALNTEFSTMGKSVITSIQSIVSSYWTQGDVKQSALTAFNNKISIDWYPLDSIDPYKAARGMLVTLNKLHTSYPTADIIISEIGCANTINLTDTQQREVLRFALNTLSLLPYVKGINYWAGYLASGGGGHTNLFVLNSRTEPRPAVNILSEFYTNNICKKRMKVL